MHASDDAPVTRLGKMIGFAVRSGNVVFGRSAVKLGVKKGRVKLIVLSADAASSTVSDLITVSERSGCPVVRYADDRPLDRMTGRVNCRCLGITDTQFARTIEKASCDKSGDSV